MDINAQLSLIDLGRVKKKKTRNKKKEFLIWKKKIRTKK